jgi:hypothetical protein
VTSEGTSDCGSRAASRSNRFDSRARSLFFASGLEKIVIVQWNEVDGLARTVEKLGTMKSYNM